MTQWSERCSELGTEEFRLFPSRKVTASVELAVIDELGVGPLGPTPRGLILFAGEYAHGNRDGDTLGVEEAALVFPIEARRGETPVFVSQ